MRISCVKKAMIKYMELQKSTFHQNSDFVLEMIESIEERNESLVTQRLFKPDEYTMMKEIGIEDNHVESLASWKPSKICDFEWVLKEGFIYMENGLFQQWQECYGIIVKSMFLHIFSSKPEFPFVEPLESIYLLQAKLMVSQSLDFYVEITENTRKGVFNRLVTGKQVVIKTKDTEILTEWMELIQSFNKE